MGRERPIRLMTNMNSHIALRQAGIGHFRTFAPVNRSPESRHPPELDGNLNSTNI